MKLDAKQHVQGTSREDEEKHLKETLDVIRANMDSYGHQVQTMREDIDEMLEHFHDDNPELINLLENTMTLHDHMKRALERNARARNKPYFGRIIFRDKLLDKEESLYIGRGGISVDRTTQAVIDWRAPIANVYYENGLGICSYTAPDGKEIQIDLKLKRTYEIEQGRLVDYFDSEVISNDELLTKYLARNKQAVLGEIVATIQKEQNEIIRRSPYHNIIVQGVAGSGKTTVAMHRISYILYNYMERFRPEDFYIVGSNRILLNYITGVLPDLDVHGVRQMTMEQLFVRLLYEDWDEKKYAIRKNTANSDKGMVKGTEKWFYDLKAFCDTLEQKMISQASIYLNPKQFVEGLQDGKAGVYDRSTGKERSEELVLLVDGGAVSRYISQNPTVSVQSKINMLNERLLIKVKDEFLGKGVKYTEPERKAIIRFYRNYYGGREWKLSTFDLYRDFLRQQAEKFSEIESPANEFDVYDLAALAYLYKRTKETEVIREASHIVIDEAQDFGMMAYRCLHFCINGCTYTVMGDVSQNIHFGFGLNDWEGLKKLLLSDEMDSFGLLKKSYRNTVEISNFATDILHHGRFAHYPVEPIIRHGDEVTVRKTEEAHIWEQAADICRTWQQKGFPTIAVVCRNKQEALITAKELGKYVKLMETDLEKAEFGNGIMVLPVEYTKGLEFDAVLILNPTRETYPVDDGHAKLLYVAATRALHELCVLYSGDLTGLIADPLPKGEKKSKEITDSEIDKAVQVKPANKKPEIVARTQNQSKVGLKKPKISIVVNKPETVNMSQPANVSKSANAQQLHKVSSQYSNVVESTAPEIRAGISFGDMPATEKLRPLGHTKIDLAVKWVMKQPDGLYLQSRYGILRLSPISSGIVRITFSKSSKILDITHPLIAARRVERYWTYRDTGKMVELKTDELFLQIDKATGAISYLTRDKQPLLSERSKECRQVEGSLGGKQQTWLFLDFNKQEKIVAVDFSGNKLLPLRQTARYISGQNELPFLISDRGYGILVPSSNPVISCDLPTYGTYLHTEEEEQMDYYFIVGKSHETLQNAYCYLTGTL